MKLGLPRPQTKDPAAMTTKTAWISLAAAGSLAAGAVVFASSGGSENRGTVIRVVDGDTVDIRVAGAETRVQLLNIDTPEAIHPDKGVECLGPEATEYLERALPAGQRVSLEYDAHRTDHAGRTLAAVYRGDLLINSDIAAQGLGIAVKFESNTKFHEQVLQAQRQAESTKAGLFSTDIACTIPAKCCDNARPPGTRGRETVQ